MDRLLLDTHVVLWALDDHPKLSLKARSAITDPANEVFVSAASIWEIAIKRSLGKLQAPDSITSWVEASGFLELPVTSFHAQQAVPPPRPLRQDARGSSTGGRANHRHRRPAYPSLRRAYHDHLKGASLEAVCVTRHLT